MQSVICVERKLKCMYRLVLLRQSNSVRPMALDTAPRSISPILFLPERAGHMFIFMSVMRFRKTCTDYSSDSVVLGYIACSESRGDNVKTFAYL